MAAEGLGRICNPDIFYRMEFNDFMLMRKGWFDEWLDNQRTMRRMTYLFVATQSGKRTPKPEVLWPLPLDEELKNQQRKVFEKSLESNVLLKASKAGIDITQPRRLIEKQYEQHLLKEKFNQNRE